MTEAISLTACIRAIGGSRPRLITLIGAMDRRITVQQFYPSTLPLKTTQFSHYTSGDNITNIDSTLEEGGTITGLVKDGTNARVGEHLCRNTRTGVWRGHLHHLSMAVINSRDWTRIRSGASLPRPSAGNDCDGPTTCQQYWDNKLTWETADSVICLDQAGFREIDFSLQPGGTISGHVFDENNDPVEGAYQPVQR